MIALPVDELEGGKTKFNAKGVSHKQNKLNWQRYEDAYNGNKDMTTNIGFRNHMQRKSGDLQTEKTWSERVLRQTAGAAGRGAHGAARVRG